MPYHNNIRNITDQRRFKQIDDDKQILYNFVLKIGERSTTSMDHVAPPSDYYMGSR